MGAALTGWSSHHFSAPISLISIMPLPKGYKQGGAEAEPVEEGSCGLCGKEVDKEVEWIEGETNYVALGSVNRGRASSYLSPPPASADAGRVALGAAADRCACHCTLPVLHLPTGTCTECGTRPFCFECVANFMERASMAWLGPRRKGMCCRRSWVQLGRMLTGHGIGGAMRTHAAKCSTAAGGAAAMHACMRTALTVRALLRAAGTGTASAFCRGCPGCRRCAAWRPRAYGRATKTWWGLALGLVSTACDLCLLVSTARASLPLVCHGFHVPAQRQRGLLWKDMLNWCCMQAIAPPTTQRASY